MAFSSRIVHMHEGELDVIDVAHASLRRLSSSTAYSRKALVNCAPYLRPTVFVDSLNNIMPFERILSSISFYMPGYARRRILMCIFAKYLMMAVVFDGKLSTGGMGLYVPFSLVQ